MSAPLPPHALLRQIAASLPPRSSVADLGCGEGHNALFLASLGHRVVAVDRDPAVLKVCGVLSGALPKSDVHELIVGDITTDLLPGREFDLVLCTYVLQLLPRGDVPSAFANIRRLTKAGGSAFIIAYVGTPVQVSAIRSGTLLPARAPLLEFHNAGWDIVREGLRDYGPLVTESGSLKASWAQVMVQARKPAATSRPSLRPALDNEELVKLQRSDPEHYEDVAHYGIA